MEIDYARLASKLYMFTIGSPYYLPKDLVPVNKALPKPPKLLNVYHINDHVVRILRGTPNFIFCNRVPDFNAMMTNPLYKVESDNSCYYDRNNAVFVISTVNTSDIQIPEEIPDILNEQPNENKPKLQTYINRYVNDSLILQHTSPYILHKNLTLDQCFYLFIISKMKNAWLPKFLYPVWESCDPLGQDQNQTTISALPIPGQIGGASKPKQKIKLTSTGKVYSVYTNSQKQKYIRQNSNKVFLSSIRGKYRYISQ
jgi:hypothetical protein